MNTLAGRSPFACRYPSRHRANSGIFSIPESTGAGIGAQNRAEDSDLGPQRLEDRSFSTECGPRRPPFAQNPVCKRPRMLNIPKNARRTPPQAPAARNDWLRSEPLPSKVPGLTPQIVLGHVRAPLRASRGGALPSCGKIWEVSPGASCGNWGGRGYPSSCYGRVT